MELSNDLILKLERMARLQLDESEREKLRLGLGQMLQMVAKLDEVDTTGVEPLVYLTENPSGDREDLVRNMLSKEAVLKNAPKTDGDFFRVPMVKKL